MIGLIVQLALTWLIVFVFEKRNRDVLGLLPTWTRGRDFSLFFILTSLCCASGFLFKMAFADHRWELNAAFSLSLLGSGLWWNIKSVLFEELIFRGALFYVAIRTFGAARAVLISAAAFAIYHWFSQELFGNIPLMVQTFLLSGAMGVLLALGYVRSGSLFVPCAIHLGWNVTQSVLFSEGNIGKQVFVLVLPAPETIVSYPEFFLIVGFPMVSMMVGNYLLFGMIPATVPERRRPLMT